MHPHRTNTTRTTRHSAASSSCSAQKVKLGILLFEAKLVSSTALHLSVQRAEYTGKPIGKVLVEQNRISEADLENALLAQSMIEEGLIDRRDATEALGYARAQNIPFAQVTKWLALGDQAVSACEKLMVEILLTTELVNERTLDEGRRIAIERDISLASALLKMRSLSFYTMNMVVECLQLINARRLDKVNAIKALKLANQENLDLAQALNKSGLKAKNTLSKLKIGDILLSARVVSEEDLLVGLEKSLNDNRMLGELLIEAGILSKDLLEESLFLQKLCQIGLLTRKTAARLIKRAHESKRSVANLSKELNIFRDDRDTFDGAIELLANAKLTEESSICSAVKHFSEYGMDPLHALVARGEISINVYHAALELSKLRESGSLSNEDAVRVLYQCHMANCHYQEAFKELEINCFRKVEKQTEEAIESGLKERFSMPELHRSQESILLAVVLVIATVSALILKTYAAQLLAAFGAVAILILSVICTYYVIKLRRFKLEACHQEMQERKEEVQQEMQRLKKFRQF